MVFLDKGPMLEKARCMLFWRIDYMTGCPPVLTHFPARSELAVKQLWRRIRDSYTFAKRRIRSC
jgi:hypothetical protein